MVRQGVQPAGSELGVVGVGRGSWGGVGGGAAWWGAGEVVLGGVGGDRVCHLQFVCRVRGGAHAFGGVAAFFFVPAPLADGVQWGT